MTLLSCLWWWLLGDLGYRRGRKALRRGIGGRLQGNRAVAATLWCSWPQAVW